MASESTELGLKENIEGALCYVIGFISGILFYLLERDNDFVRFHAAQSTAVFGGLFVLSMILQSVATGLTGSMLVMGSLAVGAFVGLLRLITTLLWVAGLILWLLLMIKAYQGERYKLPVVGDFVEDFIE